MTWRSAMSLVVVLVACLLPNSPVASESGQASTLHRLLPVIEAECEAGPDCLWQVARRLHVPLGVEFEREPSPADRSPFSLPATSVKTFLDNFVAAHPRYEWRQAGEVLVVRPRGAWSGQEGVLNRPVEPFHVEDATLPDVINLLDTSDPIRHFTTETMSPPDAQRRRVNVKFDGGSLLEAINAVARAYDYNLAWKAEYRRAERRPSVPPELEPQLTLDVFLPTK